MEVKLPWINILLENIVKEYQKNEPYIETHNPSQEDRTYINTVLSEPIGFDADSLIKDGTKYPLKKYISSNYTLLAFSNKITDLETWFRVMRCLAADKPVRVLFFGSKVPRILPKEGEQVGPFNINGGYTNKCSTVDIVIYREEDALRVLCHELLHGLCTDPNLPIAQLEANTEAWAEIIYVGFKAKGNKTKWQTLMSEQIKYAMNQASYVSKEHNVDNPDDYGWRYITGRLEVWDALGLHISDTIRTSKPKTLKLTRH